MVKDIRTNDNRENISDIGAVTTFNNILYFNATDTGGELSLFRSIGTNAGTNEIFDSDRILGFMSIRGQLLFITPGLDGQKLFNTDGTSTGTTLVKDLPPNNGCTVSHARMNDIIYFTFSGSDVLWRTDGTECGTFGTCVGLRKVDNPIAANDNLLLLSGRHIFYGEELFSVNVKNLRVPLCPETSASSENVSTALSEKQGTENVTYAPNPFSNDFTVVIKSDRNRTAEVAVQDLAGQPVMSQVVDTNKTYRLGDNWRDGIYIMRIHVDDKVTYKRIVKSGP